LYECILIIQSIKTYFVLKFSIYTYYKAKLPVRVGQKAAGLLLKIAELHKNAVDGYQYITHIL